MERLDGLGPVDHVFIITNQQQEAMVRKVCPNLPAENIIAEPIGRDTAAAVGLAMLVVQQRDADGVFAILPADAVIYDHAAFQEALRLAFEVAKAKSSLVTIGIKPSYPATGYGYIHRAQTGMEGYGERVYPVQQFVEKPQLDTATQYVESGEYYWNAGMFVWTVSAIAKALATYAPQLDTALQSIARGLAAGEGVAALLEQYYPQLEKVSIDYAVMEKADNVAVVPATFDWDDVGEWAAIARHHPADDRGNVLKGSAVVHDGSNNIVVGTDGHLTAVLGVDDLIVVRTEDATLVCPKERAQDIKSLVKSLAEHPQWNKHV